MSSQEQSSLDINRLKEAFGLDLDFTPASETLSDAVPSSLGTDSQAPDLSDLQRQRLGASGPSETVSDFQIQNDENLARRFTAPQDASQSGTAAEPGKRNRVYFRKPAQDVDTAEAFAPKPIIISGTTGTITERG
jgi:hypothetical protein